jgi:hypothetical protein
MSNRNVDFKAKGEIAQCSRFSTLVWERFVAPGRPVSGGLV